MQREHTSTPESASMAMSTGAEFDNIDGSGSHMGGSVVNKLTPIDFAGRRKIDAAIFSAGRLAMAFF